MANPTSALLLTATLLGAMSALPRASANCSSALKDAARDAPSFSDHAVKNEPAVRPAPIRIGRHTPAWQFRTALRDEYRSGEPNFAGHYRIEGWGCGTACLNWAVVDVRTGRVTFDSSIHVVAGTPEDESGDSSFSQYGFLGFRKDSRLLVVRGAPGEREGADEIVYYLWDGTRFNRIAFAPRITLCSASAK